MNISHNENGSFARCLGSRGFYRYILRCLMRLFVVEIDGFASEKLKIFRLWRANNTKYRFSLILMNPI